MQAKTFFFSFISLLVCLLLLLAGFNWLVDPAGLYAAPEVNGFNRHKPQWFYSQLVSKPYVVRRQRPDALVLGTSRAGVSLDPQHPTWSGYRVYNMALAGTTAMVQWRSFQHAMAIQPLRRVLLGLDLFMFNACRDQNSEKPVQEFLERLELPENRFSTRYPRRWLLDHAAALLSLETTRKSWRTWQQQVLYTKPDNGMLNAYRNGHWYKNFPAGTRQRSAFRSIERQYTRSDWFPAPQGCFALEQEGRESPLVALQNLMSQAHNQGVDLHLYFSPFHARLAEAMSAVGIWDEFEQLKQEVVALNEKLAEEHQREPFALWDFSGYNPVNNEPVPGAGDAIKRMHWYLDGTHASVETGNLIQNRVFGLQQSGVVGMEGFGVRLSSTNLMQHQSDIRSQRDAYRRRFPRDVQEVRTTAQRLGRLITE